MLEPIMFVAIGVFITGLLVLGVIPLVHARAVRLTQRRLEALTPLSMAEIQAEKDQLRAEFAMSTRRLEMSVEQMKAKSINQLAELGKKSEAIGRLKLELGEKSAALFALEVKEKQLADDLAAAQAELMAKTSALEGAQRGLATAQAELSQFNTTFHDSSMAADSQRVELVALRAQTEVLKGQIEGYEQELKDVRERLAKKSSEVEMLSQLLAEERGKAEQVGTRVGELERQLIVQFTESELLERRVQELTQRLDQQSRFVADREYASDQARNEALAAQRLEAEVRAALAEAETRHRAATEVIKAEKALVEEQVRQAHEERTKLQREIAQMKRDAESAWSNERMENAVLRERINDVAAEVARLTAVLEGPSSPINTMLGNDAARPADAVNGNGAPSIAPAGTEPKGSLADRIRALQKRASRAPEQSGA
jgi:chromosome segregation ATPase